IRDPEEESSAKTPTETKSKDKGKGMSYDDIRPIFEAKFNANMEFILNSKEQMEEEERRAIALINETPAQKAAKRRRLNKEAEDLIVSRKEVPTLKIYSRLDVECCKTSSQGGE
nr:hypothetical protein [Tanacetum cinerariifolium]